MSTETEALKSRCYSVIDGFAHRNALRDDDIRTWVATTVRSHGEAAVWHAIRAGGFGGSDIGILVRNFSGHRADHQSSAHKIVESKLLRSTPEDDRGDLERGHENEPLHAAKFYKKYHAHRDEAAFDALSKAQGLRVWMRYSPDDLVLLPASKESPALGGAKLKRILPDYKAPRVVEEDAEVAFQYVCQLHQGAMVCAKAGIHLDGLMLSQFDWAHWELKDDAIPYDSNLSKLILQAGDYYHDFVMRGEVPPYILTPRFERESDFIESIGLEAQRHAHLSALANAFEEETKASADRIKQQLGTDTRLAGTKLKIGDLEIKAITLVDHAAVAKLLTPEETKQLKKKNQAPEYDTAAMIQKLVELGVDTAPFRITKIDGEKAYEVLVNKGHDPEEFMKEQVRFYVSDFIKDSARDLVEATFPPIVKEVATAKKIERESAADQGLVQIQMQATEPLTPGILNIEIGAEMAQQNVREGHFTERHSQRTTMV